MKKSNVYFPKFESAMKGLFQQQLELKHLKEQFFDNEDEIKHIERRFEKAANQIMKGRKLFVDEAFTHTNENKLMFIYIRKDSDQIQRDLLEWRASKMKFDSTFLPMYIDQGIDEILWIGVSVSKNRILVESAWDDTSKIMKMKLDAGPPKAWSVNTEKGDE